MGFLASDTSASSQMKMHPRWLFFSLCRGIRTADVFIATAAVADWRPAKCAAKKLKKGEMSGGIRGDCPQLRRHSRGLSPIETAAFSRKR